MIYGKQDWTHNYFAAIGAEDTRTGNNILIDAIAKQVAWNRDSVIGVIESSDIDIKHDASQAKVIRVLQDNLGRNKKLAVNLSKLLLAEKYHNSVGDILGQTYVATKGMIKPNTDLAKAQESGEVLTGLIGSLFSSSQAKKNDQKAKEAQLAYEKQQEQNRQLEQRVNLYSGNTEKQKKQKNIILVLFGITILGIAGYFIYNKFKK